MNIPPLSPSVGSGRFCCEEERAARRRDRPTPSPTARGRTTKSRMAIGSTTQRRRKRRDRPRYFLCRGKTALKRCRAVAASVGFAPAPPPLSPLLHSRSGVVSFAAVALSADAAASVSPRLLRDAVAATAAAAAVFRKVRLFRKDRFGGG